MSDVKKINAILLYTMTSGLGDYFVMGDLMDKIETILPSARCLMVHRRNPHISLWAKDNPKERFFDIYSVKEIFVLIQKLRAERKKGVVIFGLQMAPGSIQGFSFYTVLKRLGALDYIVDFNLINADIITPPDGNYIFHQHLNQVKRLLDVEIPEEFYELRLPVTYKGNSSEQFSGHVQIGIHPWSRRGHLSCFVWPFENWVTVIEFLLKDPRNDVVIFGRDKKFDEFKNYLQEKFSQDFYRIKFVPAQSVRHLIETMSSMKFIVTVNTAVVHIGYALKKKMIVLTGPSLDLWNPQVDFVTLVRDECAVFSGSDRYIPDERFPSVARINPEKVVSVLKKEFMPL